MENLDYEEFYEDVQEGWTEQQKKDLNAAIRSAFKEMDDNIRKRKPRSAARSCCNFISQIVQDQSPSFIFTLNQDLFFERYSDRNKITAYPGLPHHLDKFTEMGEDPSRFSLRLPTETELEPSKAALFEKRTAEIAYVKLHGSMGWLSHDGSDAMLMGTQKAARIEKEPLLKWYFSLFEAVINRPNTHLLVVGYGFGDNHVNECIAKAIKSGLKLYVISPQSPQEFKDHFVAPVHGVLRLKPLGQELWDGLVQYWPAELTDFFYDNQVDLKHRGRALFRGLGLN